MILVDENAGSAATVEYVFQVLAATYGESWNRSLGKAPITDVMTVWGNALESASHSKAARKSIAWALQNLPDRCPNAMEFRSLCRSAPAAEAVALPPPKVNPEIAAKVLSGISRTSAKGDEKNWARAILRDYQAGIQRNLCSVQMARNALGEVA